jgi:hypothetical protein
MTTNHLNTRVEPAQAGFTYAQTIGEKKIDEVQSWRPSVRLYIHPTHTKPERLLAAMKIDKLMAQNVIKQRTFENSVRIF